MVRISGVLFATMLNTRSPELKVQRKIQCYSLSMQGFTEVAAEEVICATVTPGLGNLKCALQHHKKSL